MIRRFFQPLLARPLVRNLGPSMVRYQYRSLMRPFGTGMFDSMSEFLNDCPVPRERIERAKDLVKAAKPGARLPKEVLKIILFAGFAYHKVNLAIETFQDKPLRRDLLQANDMEGYQKIKSHPFLILQNEGFQIRRSLCERCSGS